jgi:hypothetical protein
MAIKPANKGPLGALADVAVMLTKSMNEVIGGVDPQKAFAPFGVKVRGDDFRAKLKEAGAASAVLMGMELELIYHKAGKAEYYLRTVVFPGPKGPAFVRINGRKPTDGKVHVTGQPLSAFEGKAAPFGEAAKSLIDSIKKGSCNDLPMAGIEDLSKFITDERLLKKVEQDLKESSTNLPAVCKDVAGVEADKIDVRIDDIFLVVVKKNGKTAGFLKGEIHYDGGSLKVGLGRLRVLD